MLLNWRAENNASRRVRSLFASAFGAYIAYQKFRNPTSGTMSGCRLNCRRLSGAMIDIDLRRVYYLYMNLSSSEIISLLTEEAMYNRWNFNYNRQTII